MSNNNTVTKFFSVNPKFPDVPDSTKYIIDSTKWSCVPTDLTYQPNAISRKFKCTYIGPSDEMNALMNSMKSMDINGGRRRTKRSSKRRRTNKRKSSKRRRTLRRRRH
jgi:hypothetical protein